MSKKVNRKVPKLRFSEFEGDWKILTIEEVASISSGGTPSRAEPTYWNGDIPWITTSETSQSEIFDSLEKITQKGLENSSAKIFPKNTILMAMYGQGKTRGQVSLLRIDAATSQNFAAITLKKGYCPEFVYCFLYQQYEHLRSLSNGNSHQNLSSGLIKSYGVPITSLAEQEKIASFLGAVDTRISQLRRKHELLQTYKRGVMQKIFSQQIRFKCNDGKLFPDWEETTLEDVASYRRGSFPQPYGLDKWYDDIYGEPFVQVYDVDDNLQLKSSTKRKISKEAIPFSVFVEKGSVILTIQGSIGRIAITQFDCYVDRTLLIFRSFLKPINKYFFIHIVLLLFEKEKEKAPGGTIKTITKESLSSFNLMLPCIEEQEKIAEFLMAIDKKIEAVAQQIKLTEQFKKGLLQKIFV